VTDGSEPNLRKSSALPGADAPGRADDSVGEAVGVGDPLGVAAIVLGCIGIVVAGIALTIVTAFVASLAGSRARESGRSLENAYLGFALAAVDGVVWLVLHLMFDIPFLLG
jgi:hypothetical protein